MRLVYVKFFLAVIMIIALGLFSLPLFQFQVSGQTYYWPALDFSQFGISSPLANFRRGEDLYPGKRITYTISFAENFDRNQDVSKFIDDQIAIIRERLDASHISDIRMSSSKSSGKYELYFTAPDYYADDQLRSLVGILTSPGDIQFIEHNETGSNLQLDSSAQQLLQAIMPGYLPNESELILHDLTSVTIEPRNSLNEEFIRLRFSETASPKLAAAILNGKYRDTTVTDDQKKPIVVLVDVIAQFILIDVGQQTEMLARALFRPTSMDMRAYSSLFLVQTQLTAKFVSTNVQTTIPAAYAPEGRVVLAISFILAAAILVAVSLMRLRRKAVVAFVLMFAGYTVMAVALLKIAAAAISLALVMAFALMLSLCAAFIIDILRHDDHGRVTMYRDMGLFVFVLLGVVYQTNLIFGAYQTFIGTLALLFFVLCAAAILIFGPIMAWCRHTYE